MAFMKGKYADSVSGLLEWLLPGKAAAPAFTHPHLHLNYACTALQLPSICTFPNKVHKVHFFFFSSTWLLFFSWHRRLVVERSCSFSFYSVSSFFFSFFSSSSVSCITSLLFLIFLIIYSMSVFFFFIPSPFLNWCTFRELLINLCTLELWTTNYKRITWISDIFCSVETPHLRHTRHKLRLSVL